MFGKVSLAAALSLLGLAGAAAADMVMQCGSAGLYYADGHIVRNMTSYSKDISGYAANLTFPLYMQIAANSSTPLYPIKLAKLVNGVYELYDQYFYIDAGLDAVNPVGFVEGGNSTLTGGQTTWGFYNPYGIFLWINTAVDPYGLIKRTSDGGSRRLASRVPVHQQGWQWKPIEGYTDISKLYWNQTRFDLAARGLATGIHDITTDFGMMYVDYDATTTPTAGP